MAKYIEYGTVVKIVRKYGITMSNGQLGATTYQYRLPKGEKIDFGGFIYI